MLFLFALLLVFMRDQMHVFDYFSEDSISPLSSVSSVEAIQHVGYQKAIYATLHENDAKQRKSIGHGSSVSSVKRVPEKREASSSCLAARPSTASQGSSHHPEGMQSVAPSRRLVNRRTRRHVTSSNKAPPKMEQQQMQITSKRH